MSQQEPMKMKVHELFVNELVNNPDFKSACSEYAAERGYIFRFRARVTPPTQEAVDEF